MDRFQLELFMGEIPAFLNDFCLLGNNNKFTSAEECRDICEETEFKILNTNRCEQEILSGPW